MTRREVVIGSFAAGLFAADVAPYKSGKGWKPLIKPGPLEGWRPDEGKPSEWTTARNVVAAGKLLKIKEAAGPILVNGKAGKTANLVSTDRFCTCHWSPVFTHSSHS